MPAGISTDKSTSTFVVLQDDPKKEKSYLNLQKEEKLLSSVLKRNVENKKSLSLHNSQLSRDSPMLHLVSKEDIVGKRKSKIWLFYRVQGNICRSFHVIG